MGLAEGWRFIVRVFYISVAKNIIAIKLLFILCGLWGFDFFFSFPSDKIPTPIYMNKNVKQHS